MVISSAHLSIIVLVLGILAYFAAAAFVLSLLAIPGLRDSTGTWARRLGERIGMAGGAALDAAQAATRRTVGAAERSTDHARATLAAHRRTLAIACAVVALPPLAVLGLKPAGWHAYEEDASDANATVSWLLRGEQLVPPPPLPPEVFMTRELAIERPEIASASRDWTLIDPAFRQKLLEVFRIMAARHGYTMALVEGYRSPERQSMLASLGSSVTNAGAFQSWHQYGLAADCAFFKDGRLIISERDPWAMRGYQLYGEVAESVGLHWGGRWKMMDFGHVELRRAGVRVAAS